jgi:hypothetical protein
MLLEPHSRFFLRHQLIFRTPYEHGVPLKFHSRSKGEIDVEDVLKSAMDKGKASLVLRNDDVVRLTALDVRSKSNLAILLFRRSDPDAATPIFENATTKKLRRSDKGPDDAIAVSAHMFVRLGDPVDDARPTYRAVLEEVPGLSRTYIQALLHDVVKEHVYSYADKRGQPKETYTIVDFRGVKSEKVSGALQGASVVPSVVLVRPGNIRGMDTEGLVVAREEKMKLILKATPEQTLGIIKKIQNWMKKHDWSKLLVEMDMPEKRSRLVSLAREADAADILFIRSVPIKVDGTLEACTETINEELVSKAQELFAADDA